MNKKAFNLMNLIRPNVLKMASYSSARDEFNGSKSDMIFLDANENPHNSNVNRYPDPQQKQLKELISQQKSIPVSNILLGNGSDEVIDLIFRAFCEPKKDNILTLPPTYGMYNVLANLNDVENREVLLGSDFQPNIKEVLKTIDSKTKIIFLCSPNNPTGNLIEIDRIVYLLNHFKGILVIDEAYIDFANQASWSNKLGEFPNLMVIQTLSKAYGLAGIRLGICYGSTNIISVLNKIKPPYNINQLTQNKAIERLLNSDKIKNEIYCILDMRDSLYKALVKVSFIKTVYPSEANFLLIVVDDAEKRHKQLIEKDIVVRMRNSQPLCENSLRISIGTTAEVEKLILTLKSLEQ